MNDLSTSVTHKIPVEGKTVSPGEIIIGELSGIDDAGRPLVRFGDMDETKSLLALTTQEISLKHVGRQVALLFASGEPSQPVIIGLIQNPLTDILENFSISDSQTNSDTPFPEVSDEQTQHVEVSQDEEQQVVVDGKRVTIQGAEEITLKCGKASITLTKSGKILLRGTYLSNRSSGVNRIMGGSVQIN